MTRFSPLSALLLLAALSACSGSAPRAQQNAPQATQEIVSGAVIFDEATGAPVVTQNTPEPTALPTADATKAQMLVDIKAANDRAGEALNKLNDQAVAIAKSYADASASNAQTAQYGAHSADDDLKKQQEITQQMAHDNERLILLAELAKAQATEKEADARLVLVLCVTVVTVSLVLLCVRALARHPLPVAVVHGPDVMRPYVPTGRGPGSVHTLPLPIEPDIMYRFMIYATQGLPLGTGSMETAHVFKSTERWYRTEIITYLDKTGHLAHDTGLVLTDAAKTYWLDWMQRYSPAPNVEIAESAAFARHDHDNMAVFTDEKPVGEGDPFNIAPKDGEK